MVRISSIGRSGNDGVTPTKKSPDMKSWRNRGCGCLRQALLCVRTLVPNQLRRKPEILVERTITTDMDYAENDVVLCYHGPLLYEAKVRSGVWQFQCGLF